MLNSVQIYILFIIGKSVIIYFSIVKCPKPAGEIILFKRCNCLMYLIYSRIHKVKLREKISDSVPVGSIATVLYIDDLDNVFIEWVSNGRLTSFSKKNFKSLFETA